MQEPKRKNLLNSLIKSLNTANRKNFLHRLIYIIKFNNSETNLNSWRIIYDNKFLSKDKIDDSINGISFYIFEYAINIVEVFQGSEDNLNKHIRKLAAQKNENHFIGKVLIFMPHILKRYFTGWQSIALESTSSIIMHDVTMNTTLPNDGDKVRHFITNILKLSEYLANTLENDPYDELKNVSETCKNLIPEADLLESLIDSPLLLSIEDYYQNQRIPLSYQHYHDVIWPLPATFVPTIYKKHSRN